VILVIVLLGLVAVVAAGRSGKRRFPLRGIEIELNPIFGRGTHVAAGHG
jgi:hypothetical protein